MSACEYSIFFELFKRIKHSFFLVSDNDTRFSSHDVKELFKDIGICIDRLTIGDNELIDDYSFDSIIASKYSHHVLTIALRFLLDYVEGQIETYNLAELIILLFHVWCDNYEDVGDMRIG